MPQGASPYASILAIASVLFVINLPSVLVWALFGSGLRRFLDSPLRRRCFNGAMAASLIATAIVMLPRPS
jgi:threonine/homoserine/homoserine lactone efflux protein